jgi:biopolymer transport protein ExbD
MATRCPTRRPSSPSWPRGKDPLDDQAEVHIKPNKLVDYGAVAAVMAAAQRLNVKKMGMVGNEQFVK